MKQYFTPTVTSTAICAVFIIIQMNMFVRTDTLEIKHREILEDVRKEYASRQMVDNLASQVNDMKGKIDKIYTFLLKGNG